MTRKFKPIEEVFWLDPRFTAGDQFGTRVVALARGGFVICWTDAGDHGDGYGSCVRAQIYDEHGRVAGEQLLIGGANELDRYDDSIAATAGGGFVVSWTVGAGDKEGFPSWIEAQAFDARGVAVGKDVVVTDRIGAGGSTVTALSDGRFMVGWSDPSPDGGDVHAALYWERGRRIGDVPHLGDGADGLQTSLASAQLASGGFVSVWANDGDGDRDDDGFGLLGMMYGPKGEPLTDPFQINLGTKLDQTAPQVAAVGGGFVVVWADREVEDQGALHARFFDENGRPLGDDITIADRMHDADLAPVVTVNADGQVLIACASGGVIYAELFGADGVSLSDVYQVGAPDGSDRSNVSVAALPSGEFVLTWTEHDPKSGDGSGSTVEAQIIGVGSEQAGRDDTFEIAEDGQLQVHWKELFENDGLSPRGAVSLDYVDGVTHGSVKVDDEGFISFTPDADFNGTASFTYHLKDDDGFTDTATVWIVVAPVDDAPVATDDGFAASEDSVLSAAVGANDIDVDSTELRYSLLAPVAGLTMADDGTFSFDAGDAAYQHLAAGEVGIVTATYQVADETGQTGTAVLTIDVVGTDDAPDAPAFKAVKLLENAAAGAAAGWVTANDVDGDTLVYSLKDDASGRFVIDAATGALAVADGAVLDYEANRSFRLVVDVADGHGGLAEREIVVRLADVAETISGTDRADRLHAIGSGDWRIEGLGGDDVLVDGGGHVTLVGGGGNDQFVVRNGATEIVEGADEGWDTVATSLSSYTLGDNVEALRVVGAASFTGAGNDLGNVMRGARGDDALAGAGGSDQLYGGGGGDTLNGDAGDDMLVGGEGSDVLTGGADADRFRFLLLEDSSRAGGLDRITDFNQAEHDRIDVSRIDGVAGVSGSRFTFIGDAAFDGHAGQLRYEQVGGATVVSGDVNGDGVSDFILSLDGAHLLVKADFVL